MSIPPVHTSNLVIILINVDVTTLHPVYTSYFLADGSLARDPVNVGVGDRIGWYVQVFSSRLPSTVPYQLTFSNPAFFGLTSLLVPAGGGSGYLLVQPGGIMRTKYTLTVNGVYPPFDPQIQTDGGPLKKRDDDDTVAKYVVSWQPNSDPASLTCTKDGVIQPFPLDVSPGDTVEFVASASTPPNFSVVFDRISRPYVSPFSLVDSTFVGTPINGVSSSTGQLTVLNVSGPDKTYNFQAVLDDGTHSKTYKIIVK